MTTSERISQAIIEFSKSGNTPTKLYISSTLWDDLRETEFTYKISPSQRAYRGMTVYRILEGGQLFVL